MGARRFYFYGLRFRRRLDRLGRYCFGVALLGLLIAVPELRAEKAVSARAVASEHPLATREAMAELRAGGNAVDAAVTAAFVTGVVNPTSSGIGGGGFVLYWDAQRQRASSIDFREAAPRAIDVSAFEQRPLPASERGKLVGVPGEVAGLFTLHQRYGKRRWDQVLAPAILAAEKGFRVEPHLARAIQSQTTSIKDDALLSAFFFPGGQTAPAGAWRKNPTLARTLRRIAALGPWGFYDGPVAADVVGVAQAQGGALTLEDLQSYRALDREPLHVRWEGYDVYTMPPPSAGGLMLMETLHELGRDELRALGEGSGAYYHVLAEVLRGAVADRLRYLGDPAFEAVDIARLLDAARLQARKAGIRMDTARPLPSFVLDEHGTHHLVTADAAGDMVSLTTTVNHAFGAKLMTSSGVILNDELDDFSKRGDATAFGVVLSPNRARPGARPVSSMTPTLVVQEGRAVLALGGSGGTKIAPNVTETLLSRLVFGLSPEIIVGKPRISIPSSGPSLSIEDTASESLIGDLRARGETVDLTHGDTSGVQMIARDGARWSAASDPRKFGFASSE